MTRPKLRFRVRIPAPRAPCANPGRSKLAHWGLVEKGIVVCVWMHSSWGLESFHSLPELAFQILKLFFEFQLIGFHAFKPPQLDLWMRVCASRSIETETCGDDVHAQGLFVRFVVSWSLSQLIMTTSKLNIGMVCKQQFFNWCFREKFDNNLALPRF